MTNRVCDSEPIGSYANTRPFDSSQDDLIIAHAMAILKVRMRISCVSLNSSETVRNYLALKLESLEAEVFGVLMLDAQHRLIEDVQMFTGTISQTSVDPREVVKSALLYNAAAIFIYHNHPSGLAEPSLSDRMLTKRLQESLALVEIRLLDHIVVAGGSGGEAFLFSENGML